MRNLLSALVLATFLALALVPVALAEDTPKECCTLNRDLVLKGNHCDKAMVAAPNSIDADKCGNNDSNYTNDGYCATSTEANWGMFCLMSTLYGVTDWIFIILIAVAGIMIILGAFFLLTSGGNPEKTLQGRNYILYAAIGLVAGFFARAIPSLVRMVIGS